MKYNFFQPEKSRKNFLNQRGFTGNEAAETMFGGAFDAANKAGATFLDQYDFSTGDNADLQRGLSTASQMGFTNYLNDFRNQDNFVNPFGGDESVFNTSINPGDFFRSNNAGFFDMPADAPNQDMFDDVTQNTFTSRPATQADVDDGLATNVGDLIEELNPPAIYEALGAQYNEELADKLKELREKEGASEDYYNALTEITGILNASRNASIDNYETDMTGGIENYTDSLNSNLSIFNTNQQTAINNLANTRAQNAVNEYRAIDDALRANTLGAMRAGEFGTRGASNRMLVDAAMRAASDRQNVIGDINLQKAEDLYALQDSINRQKQGISDQEAGEKFGLANTTTTQRKALRDNYAIRTSQLGEDYQTRVKALRDNLANYLGSTPDQIDPIMQMAKDYVAITAEQGEAATLTAQEAYDALNQAVNMLLEEPNTFLQLQQSQIADELGAIVLGEQNYRDLMAGKFNNIEDTIAMIEGLATNDPRLDGILSRLNAAKKLLDAGQAALGTNPLPSGQVAVPSFDAGAATLSLDRLSAGTGTQDDIANIQGLIDLAKDIGDIIGGLGGFFGGGDDTPADDSSTEGDT